VHKTPLRICEFREDHRRQGRAAVMDIQLQVQVYRETAWRSDSKEHLDKFCILRHGVRYLPLVL
jgi:hypothetical protein